MALVVTKTNKFVEIKLIQGFFTVVASSNYAAGGEVLGLKALFGTHKDPIHVVIRGKAGFVYEYDFVNDKMMVFVNVAGGANAALGEHTAAAYVAGILADVIKGYAVFPKA